MANLTVIIDGEIGMDGDPGQWTDNQAPLLIEQLKTGNQPAPWMRATLIAAADAIMRDTAASNGLQLPPTCNWTMRVQYNGPDTSITITTDQAHNDDS